jgi:phenylpyruvate tautomerase PptA (4-oxalocrotonate tautomerase family)
MPFVRISVSPGFDQAQVREISDGVHEAMVATIDVPAADRFQVVTKHAPDEMIWDRNFLDVNRSDRAVFVHITLSAGRDDDKKRALYRAIAQNLSTRAGVRAEDVLIVLSENVRPNWSFGNGIAQYAIKT